MKDSVKDGVRAEEGAEEAEEEAEEAGYRIKNKNPTQRCREKPFLQSVQ